MSDSNGTIIIGALDDSELRKSIDRLVQAVERNTKTMGESFDTAINKMVGALGKLRTAANQTESAMSRRSQNNTKEAGSIRVLAESYDALANAQQKSARESAQVFMRQFKADDLARQIREAEAALQRATSTQVDAITQKIERAKAKVDELNQKILAAQERRTSYSSQPHIDALRKDMEYQLQLINRFKQEMATAGQNSPQAQRLRQLQNEYDAIVKRINESAQATQKLTDATQQQAVATRQVAQAQEQSRQTMVGTIGPRRPMTAEEMQKKNDADMENWRITQQQIEAGQRRAQTERQVNKEISERPNTVGIEKQMLDVVQRYTMVERNRISLTQSSSVSMNKLKESINQMVTAYNKMDVLERKSAVGDALLQRIQAASRELQKLQAQMQRPINAKQAFGLAEKTLDDMAYKMRMLQNYRSGLDTTTQANEIRRVTEEMERLRKKQNEIMGNNKSLMQSNDALARSFNYMKNRLAFYFTIGASTQFVRSLIEIRSQYEMTERALGVLVGSAQRGSEIFRELSSMALKSPFTLIELSGAARQLTAYDIAASNVVDTTRRLADMASAVGAPIERLTYALGQIKAYGYLNARDARMFANAGIPLVRELADHYSKIEQRAVSVAEVYDRIKKKEVQFGDVMSVVNEMTDKGGRFFNFQEKMADTLKVKLANLTLAYNNMLNEMGASNQTAIEAPIRGLTILFKHWQDVVRLATDAAFAFGALKVSSMALSLVMTRTTGFMQKSVLATKASTVAALKKKAATEGLTKAEKKQLATAQQITKQDYAQELSKRKLTTAQAKLLAYRYRDNAAMQKAILELGLLTKEEQQAAIAMTRIQRVGARMRGMFSGMAGLFSPQMLVGAGLMVGLDLWQKRMENLEQLKNFRQSIFDGVQESTNSISKFLRDYNDAITKVVGGGASQKESLDLWLAIKEQIENSTNAGKAYVEMLEGVDNYSQRVKDGVQVLNDAAEAMRRFKYYANTIDFTQDFDYWEEAKRSIKSGDTLLNMMPIIGPAHAVYQTTQINWEGLNQDAQDYNDRLRDIQKVAQQYNVSLEYTVALMDKWNSESERQQALMDAGYNESLAKSLAEAYSGGTMGASLKTQREELMQEIDATIADFIPKLEARGTLERNELFETLSLWENQIVEANQNIEGEARNALHRGLVEALPAQYNEYKDELMAYSEPMRQFFDFVYAENKDTFDHMTREEIEQIDWSTGKWKEILDNAFRELEKVTIPDTYNAIVRMVNNANSMTISIPVLLNIITNAKGTIDTEFQRAYDQMTSRMTEANRDWLKFTPAAYRPKEGDNPFTYGKYIKEQTDKAKKDFDLATRNIPKLINLYGRESTVVRDAEDALHTLGSQYATLLTLSQQFPWDEPEKAKKKGGGGRRGGGAKPEDIVAKAIREEIKIVNEIRGNYDKLRKAGAADADAIEIASDGYAETIKRINNIFKQFGIAEFDASAFTGKNVTELRDFFSKQLTTLLDSGKVKLESVSALNAEVKKLDVSVGEYNLQKVTDGLNAALEKIKGEYELAVELDANPELGNAFADYLGIDDEDFPHTMDEAIRRIQESIDKELGKGRFNVMQDNLKAWADKNTIEKDSKLYNELANAQKYVQDLFKKNFLETEKIMDEYVKRFGDYSDRIAEIEAKRLKDLKGLNERYYTDQMRATSDYARKYKAIMRMSQRDKDEALWSNFKESPFYVELFENLDRAGDKSLQMLKSRLEDVRDTLNGLKPESLKAVMDNIEKVDDQMLKRHRFRGFGKNLREYIAQHGQRRVWEDRAVTLERQTSVSDDELAAMKEQLELLKSKGELDSDDAQALQVRIASQEALLALQKEELKDLLRKIGLNEKLTEVLGEQFTNAKTQFDAYLASTKEVRDLLQEAFGIEVPELDGFVEGMERASNATENIVKSAMGGNWMGVIAGTGNFLYGIWDGIASIFGGGSAKNRKIDKAVKKSEREVKRLENAYKDLERAVKDAMGAEEIRATKSLAANKRLQLAETENQLRLEKSRSKKKQDQDKIIDLEGQVQDLKNEINDLVSGIAGTLLGSDIKNAAESFVSTWIGAWKQGEDTMSALKESFQDTIETMITKSVASSIVAARLRKIYDMVDDYTSEQSESGVGLSYGELRQLRATMQEGGGIVEGINQDLANLFNALGLRRGYGAGGATGELSALQQGIQGITEDTAGALEAYMNGVSGQVYLQTTLMQSIATTLAEMNPTENAATTAAILLQLQQSYQVQNAIQYILTGWSSANGRSIRVEMI